MPAIPMPEQRQARFIDRRACINCRSESLVEVSGGRYVDQPLLSYLEGDPWGQSPLPFLQEARWSLVRCNVCAQLFHRHVLDAEWNEIRFSQWMSAEAIASFEERIGTATPAARFEQGRQWVQHVLQIEHATRAVRDGAVRLLDFGCGYGFFVSTCNLFGFEAVGVDRSTARAQGAAGRIYASLDEVADRAPFHAVTLFEVLEHLDQPADILTALAKLLVPGGTLVLETPDCTGVTGIVSRDDYLKIHPLDHINAFTNTTLAGIARRSGFVPFRVAPPAHVATDLASVVRRTAKAALRRDRVSTQLYFRKLPS
jgi:SAM-dependent methyltransferase